MIYTQKQIEEILKIIDKNTIIFGAIHVGTDQLSEYDKWVLKSSGIDLEKLKEDFPLFQQPFYFGRLSQVLGMQNTKKLKYEDFFQYLRKGQYHPLNSLEKEMLEVAKNRSYSHIKGLGDRQKETVRGIILEEDARKRSKYEKTIKEEVERGIKDRDSLSNIASEIGKKTGDWQRDMGRIVDTEMNTIMQEGRAAEIKRQEGKDTKVYKDVYSGACRFCIRDYLTGGIGSQPKLFTLEQLELNGTNVGRKVADWKPVVGSHHPFCFDKETEVLTDEGWKYWFDVTGNEKFLSFDLKYGDGEWVKAKKLIKYHYNGDMINFKSKTFNLMTTPNHHHVIKNHGSSGKYFFEETRNIQNKHRFVRKLPNWEGLDLDFINIGNTKYNALLFTEFLGYFLSEGYLEYGSYRYTIRICQSKKKYWEDILNCCKNLFYNRSVIFNNDKIIVGLLKKEDLDLISYLQQFGKSYEKYIPNNIKELSKRLLLRFIDSFRMGDGGISEGFINNKKTQHTKFYTSSKKMAGDLMEIILKLGYATSMSIREPDPVYDKKQGKFYLSKYLQYIVRLNKNNYAYVSSLDKICVPYNDYVYDVELEKYHTLFVRRNGKVCVSGNCRCNLHKLLPGQVWDEEKKDFVYPEKFERKVEIKHKDKITVGDKVFYI